MGVLKIDNIVRNPNSPSQNYLVQYRKTGNITWIDGPTIPWAQCLQIPNGVLPILIPLLPASSWSSGTIDVRIGVITSGNVTPIFGGIQVITITDDDCT